MNDYVLEGIAKLQSLDNPVVHCRMRNGVLVDRELGVPVITRFDRSIYLKIYLTIRNCIDISTR
jgi:hypothetical protein